MSMNGEIRQKLALVFVILLSCVVLSSGRAKAREERQKLGEPPTHTPLYLPQLNSTRLLSLGYDSVLSRILWFSTINYFGKQVMAGKDTPWITHMCNLVVGLDAYPTDPIEFCGVIIPWMAKDPKSGEALLTLGIKQHPSYWRMYYMRGFIRWYFLEDFKSAQEDMVRSSECPDAPPFVHGIASKLLAQNQNSAVARQFIAQMLERTKDPVARTSLEEQLRMAILGDHLEALREASRRYEARFGKKPQTPDDLVKEHILRAIPNEPYGGIYSFHPETGVAQTSSGKKPLAFGGKTAKTGVFAEQFQDLKIPQGGETP